MKTRRQFLTMAAGFVTGLGMACTPLLQGVRSALARAGKIILPKGTPRESLKTKNPALIDARNLETTPLKDFGTMGLTDHQVPETWRLKIKGLVKSPLELSLDEIREFPHMERRVLLICPGFFGNHGKWKGISMKSLLEKAGMMKGVTHVTFSGPESDSEMTQSYPLDEVLSNRVFLAYEVNGRPLPQKHGFPLRVVAEGYYGYDWIKYVYKVTLERIKETGIAPSDQEK